MTSLYRPSRNKAAPRLKKLFLFGQWRWICYGTGAFGVGAIVSSDYQAMVEAYQTWAADLEMYHPRAAVRLPSKSPRGTSD